MTGQISASTAHAGPSDIAGPLPAALRRRGHDVRAMMPAYPAALKFVRNSTVVMHREDVSGLGAVDFLYGESVGTGNPVWLVRSNGLFEDGSTLPTDGHSASSNEMLRRSALLCCAAAEFVRSSTAWEPSLVHAHDWHAALIPSLLLARPGRRVPCVLTVTDARDQGRASTEQLNSFGVPSQHVNAQSPPARSFLGIGVCHADHLATVSPTYAKEIQTARFAYGLERLFASRSRCLTGILNGVEYEDWDPGLDPLIAQHYDADDLSGKARCKEAVVTEMKLETASFAPLIGLLGPLTTAKGADLALSIADVLVTAGARIVILGEGEHELEQSLRELARRYPTRVAVNIRQDEPLAHRIMAGADIVLVPSRNEPCGVHQLRGLRYGAVPVVAAVGGLADSVADAGQRGIDRGATTGFFMRRAGPSPLAVAVGKAMAVYPIHPLWQKLQRNGMRMDFGWDQSAQKYSALYERVAS